MLVLTRKIGEKVVIGNNIRVTVLGFDRGFIKLGIEAPRNIPVHRQEVYDQMIEINVDASSLDLGSISHALQDAGLQDMRKRKNGSLDSA